MKQRIILFFGQHGGLPSRTEDGNIASTKSEDRRCFQF